MNSHRRPGHLLNTSGQTIPKGSIFAGRSHCSGATSLAWGFVGSTSPTASPAYAVPSAPCPGSIAARKELQGRARTRTLPRKRQGLIDLRG